MLAFGAIFTHDFHGLTEQAAREHAQQRSDRSSRSQAVRGTVYGGRVSWRLGDPSSGLSNGSLVGC